MQYEIDYFPIGDESKGGDAIIITYGEDITSESSRKVVVIDCGTKTAADNMITHFTEQGIRKIDLIIATHLHSDHVGGIPALIENISIDKIAIHQPRNHTSDIKKMSTSYMSTQKLETKIEKSLSNISSIVDLAESKGINIVEPFALENIIDHIRILGPSKEYYIGLATNFGKVPVSPKEENLIERTVDFIEKKVDSFINWVEETFEFESLSDEDDTDPENNSSMIILFSPDGKKKMLFTGDAGKEALGEAIKNYGVVIKDLDFLDVPHHGSKRNLGPTILNHLKPKQAFISCPVKGDPKHPSRKVINALIRRGCNVHVTKGLRKLHHNTSGRGWATSNSETFYDKVEE